MDYRDFMSWDQKISKILKEGYDSIGFQAERGMFRDIICTLLEAESNKNRILDVGCGPGKYLEGISSINATIIYTGLDYSPHMIEIAQEKYKDFPNARFIVGDIHDLQFDNDSFDLVICSEVLSHL